VKRQDGSLKNYTMDASRSDPSKNLIRPAADMKASARGNPCLRLISPVPISSPKSWGVDPRCTRRPTSRRTSTRRAGQLAGETEACRYLGTLSTSLDPELHFSSIGLGSGNGLAGVLNTRQMLYAVASGYQWIRPRPWAWYWLFKMNNPVPAPGARKCGASFRRVVPGRDRRSGSAPGTMTSGSFTSTHRLDRVYSLLIDCSCYPSAWRRTPMSRRFLIYFLMQSIFWPRILR